VTAYEKLKVIFLCNLVVVGRSAPQDTSIGIGITHRQVIGFFIETRRQCPSVLKAGFESGSPVRQSIHHILGIVLLVSI